MKYSVTFLLSFCYNCNTHYIWNCTQPDGYLVLFTCAEKLQDLYIKKTDNKMLILCFHYRVGAKHFQSAKYLNIPAQIILAEGLQ